jgi:hypothetical protein
MFAQVNKDRSAVAKKGNMLPVSHICCAVSTGMSPSKASTDQGSDAPSGAPLFRASVMRPNHRALYLARVCALFEWVLEERVSPTREAGSAFWQLIPT